MRGISANVMCGQEGLFGTAAFQVVLDINEMMNLDEKYKFEYKSNEDIIDAGLFDGIGSTEDNCSQNKIRINNNAANVIVENTGEVSDQYNPF
jgi:DNA-directed RNA polymerase II subunit RPB1